MVASAQPGGKMIRKRPLSRSVLPADPVPPGGGGGGVGGGVGAGPSAGGDAGPGDAALLVHDVRNLLHAAHNHAEILECELTAAAQRERLRAIRQSVAFAASLCEDLLAAAAAGRKAPFADVDLGTVATSATAAFRALAGDGVAVQFAGPEERIFVRGRQTEIERAILNLMWNALDAMQQAQVAAPRLDLAWGREARGAFFQVRDYGPGLPAGKLGDLTQAFRSGHAPGGLVRGLGLTGVQRILQEHHGALESGAAASGPGAVLRLQFGVQRELEFGE